MREIKFRYWNPYVKRYFIDKPETYKALFNQIRGIYDVAIDGGCFEQYTGLDDINGKQIFEGDILKVKTDKLNICSKVSFSGGSFVLTHKHENAEHLYAVYYVKEHSEIVGDIHHYLELP